MIRRLQDILDNIYTTPTNTLEEEHLFWTRNGQYKYVTERILKEIERRKTDNEIKDPPKNIRLVYVIKCNEYYKIGLTDEVENRVISLQIGNPYKLQLYLCTYFDDAEKMEADLHKKFRKKNIRGEWFKLDKEDLAYLKKLFNAEEIFGVKAK